MFGAAGWTGGSLLVSLFGLCFAASRVMFGSHIERVGGYRVAGLALGLEAVGLGLIWQAATRGGALGFYTVFLDLALAAAGPLAGLVLPAFGYSGIFAATAACALAGGIIVAGLSRMSPAPEEP